MFSAIKEIYKIAKIEAEWMAYYGHVESREDETFDDVLFYDRMKPIGYSKVYTPLHIKCAMGFVNTLNVNSNVVISNGPRDHSKNVYTCLEFVIHNKIGHNQLIDIIKKRK